MAWRYQNTNRYPGRLPNYYAGNKLYPGSYAPVEWGGRTSRRIHDGLNLSPNYGLDTISDDVNSSPYSSPYYVNGRYLSENLVTQRGNSASVQGTKFLASYGDEEADFSSDDAETTIKLWQGKQIKFKTDYSGKIVAVTVTIKNTMSCTGILSIYLSAKDGGEVLSETSVDLCKVSTDKFEHFVLRTMTPVDRRANPLGEIYVRMEIWDEIDLEKHTENPFNTGKYIEIAATGKRDMRSAVYTLTDKNHPVTREITYVRHPSQPLIGFYYNDFVSVPMDRLGNEKTGASVSKDGYRYDLFTIKDSTHSVMLVYDKEMGTLTDTEVKIDGRTTQVQIAEVVDTDQNVWIYYVDGYSPLQRFKIGEWDSEEVVSEDEDNPIVKGASFILFHNNRLYLAGFRDDPNLVQFSAIESSGANFEAFPYRFYAPNVSPYATSTNTITAMVEYASDEIMILGKNFYSIYTTNVNIESTDDDDSYPTQVSSYMDAVGVRSQGDVTNYKGVLYSFDPKEGIRRYSGAVWTVIPNNISSLYDRVDMDKNRKIWGFRNKLYFNYTDRVDGKSKCIVWDMGMNYQQYPFFQDIDLPFCDVRYDESEELVGIHPDCPTVMNLYAEDTWRRLDTPIVFERHTKYLSIPGNSADMVVKRVHNKVIANANRWWWFSVVFDKEELVQTRGEDKWYRVPAWATASVSEPVEEPFPSQDIYEKYATLRLSLLPMRIRCSSVQVKIKAKTFRAQCSLVSTLVEAEVKPYI